MHERCVAVDNVCAWPNLTRMPDGAIIATMHTPEATLGRTDYPPGVAVMRHVAAFAGKPCRSQT